jgi:hypothetical protein
MHLLLPALGVVIIAIILADIYLTVLYARIGCSLISDRLSRGTWLVFKFVTRGLKSRRDKILTYCGPTILVLLVSTWVLGLMIGSAMIIYPKLGTSLRANSGQTSTTFPTAIYVAGDSLTTVGTSDISPQTGFFRIYYTVSSFVGMSIITLTLTYFLEVYNALQRRNTFAMKLHSATGGTGDAAELLAGLGPAGHFDTGYTHLAEIGAEMASFKESHHFYSVLLYFRYSEPHYAMARMALICVDTISLLKSTLDDEEFGWIKQSAAVTQIWRESMNLLAELSQNFLPGGMPQSDEATEEQKTQQWRDRYLAALRRLRQADIKTIADENNGVETYIALRMRWDRFIRAFADYMALTPDAVDQTGENPQSSDERQTFRTRLRSAG